MRLVTRANARIYFAPAKPQGLVVGEEIPAEILERAREAEAGRRRAAGSLDPAD